MGSKTRQSGKVPQNTKNIPPKEEKILRPNRKDYFQQRGCGNSLKIITNRKNQVKYHSLNSFNEVFNI